MPAERVVSLERDGHVARVWLDRPSARNAMGHAFFEQLPEVFAEIAADDDLRAVVVAARGEHFTVGLDLKEIGSSLAGGPPPAGGGGPRRSPAAGAALTRRAVLEMQQSITAVAACPKPVVAAVHGYCIGGGIDLITACDIRIASADAVFSVRETKVAIVADLGTLQRLPRLIGAGHVAELAYTGKDIDAERARRIGLVNDVHPDAASLQTAAATLAGEIAANSPLTVQGTKAVLQACADRTIAEGLDYVATWNAGMLQSADLIEAMTAFIEKRPPNFTGD